MLRCVYGMKGYFCASGKPVDLCVILCFIDIFSAGAVIVCLVIQSWGSTDILGSGIVIIVTM